LMIDKYFFIKGGAERYFFELKKLLEMHGHQVIPFAMQHPDNFDTPYSNNFVGNIEFNGLSFGQKIQQASRIIGRVIYSQETKAALSKLIEREKPDIAHLHMIEHQFSPSILHALRDFNIPIIQTCHQYKLICPSYRLFIMHKNQICEKCVHGHYYHAVLEHCHKNSFAASGLVAVESYIHKWMDIYNLIDVFHVPSRFLGQKLVEGGYSQEKIWHCFYTINLDDYPFHLGFADYAIFSGRLSEEKGVLTLLQAMSRLPELRLLIIGEGPQRPVLAQFVRKHHLNNVEFLGNQNREQVVQWVQLAKFVIVPSEWYDNSPLVIYEAFSMGKPVIASSLGGMPELVEDGVEGLLVPPGDPSAMADAITRLLADPGLASRLGVAARERARTRYSREAMIRRYEDLYHRLCADKAATGGRAGGCTPTSSAASGARPTVAALSFGDMEAGLCCGS